MLSSESYLSVASILSGFCVAVFVFRIQREVAIIDRVENRDSTSKEKPENWLAWSDYLIVTSILLSMLLVVLPLMVVHSVNDQLLRLAAASCAASSILLSAYPFAILDHYRILWGKERKEKRLSGEPLERFIVIAALIVAAVVWGIVFSPNFYCR